MQPKKEPKHQFTKFANRDVRSDLATLQKADVSSYRAAMQRLGEALAVATQIKTKGSVAVVTTPEDADFLTRGFLEALPTEKAHLVCYWTERLPRADVASVVQRFEEPDLPSRIDTVVVLKAIISSGCTVRANLEEFLQRANPARIVIAAPVMLKGADEGLREQFSKTVSKRFEFVTFAEDSTKADDVVRPGVGGWVDKRLGLGKRRPRALPALVEERRAAAN